MAERDDQATPITLASTITPEERERFDRWERQERQRRAQEAAEQAKRRPEAPELTEARELLEGMLYSLHYAIREGHIDETAELRELIVRSEPLIKSDDAATIRAAVEALEAYCGGLPPEPDPPIAARMPVRRA